MSNLDKPAFPAEEFIQCDKPDTINPIRHLGMSLREYAAIKLRVPDSGTDWLDAMIEKSLLNEFAGKAMQALIAASDPMPSGSWPTYAERTAQLIAQAMLKASKGE